MLGGTPPAAGAFRRKVIHNGIDPRIADQVQVRIFIDNAYQVLFCIPAVTEDGHMFFPLELGHDLSDHGSSQFQLGFLFLPHAVTQGYGEIRYFLLAPNRDTKQDAYKTVAVQVVGAIMCGMVEQI